MSVLLTLFFAFIQVDLFSVGGGYTAILLIQPQVVNIHRLIVMEEFADLITIAEMTSGPISVNSSTFVGMRLAGPMGVILCTPGCIIPSFIVCLVLTHFYYKYRGSSDVQTVLASLRPTVVVLIGSARASILILALFNSDIFFISLANTRWVKLVLFLGCLFTLRKQKTSAISIIFGSGLVGTLAYLVF